MASIANPKSVELTLQCKLPVIESFFCLFLEIPDKKGDIKNHLLFKLMSEGILCCSFEEAFPLQEYLFSDRVFFVLVGLNLRQKKRKEKIL